MPRPAIRLLLLVDGDPVDLAETRAKLDATRLDVGQVLIAHNLAEAEAVLERECVDVVHVPHREEVLGCARPATNLPNCLASARQTGMKWPPSLASREARHRHIFRFCRVLVLRDVGKLATLIAFQWYASGDATRTPRSRHDFSSG